jgi:hypothetical protein
MLLHRHRSALLTPASRQASSLARGDTSEPSPGLPRPVVVGPYLAALIHRIAGIRWRVSHNWLTLFTDWVSRPLHSPDHSEPHPPCTTIR